MLGKRTESHSRPVLRCEDCATTSNSQMQLTQHLTSPKHINKVQKKQTTGVPFRGQARGRGRGQVRGRGGNLKCLTSKFFFEKNLALVQFYLWYKLVFSFVLVYTKINYIKGEIILSLVQLLNCNIYNFNAKRNERQGVLSI